MGFNVQTLEGFEYDFTQIPKQGAKAGVFCKGKGLIPEPSETEMANFLEAIANAAGVDVKKAEANGTEGGDGGATPVTGVATATTKTDVQIIRETLADPSKQRRELTELIAKLTKSSPGKQELNELPPRWFNGFVNWLVGEVGNPTVSTNATAA